MDFVRLLHDHVDQLVFVDALLITELIQVCGGLFFLFCTSPTGVTAPWSGGLVQSFGLCSLLVLLLLLGGTSRCLCVTLVLLAVLFFDRAVAAAL